MYRIARIQALKVRKELHRMSFQFASTSRRVRSRTLVVNTDDTVYAESNNSRLNSKCAQLKNK